MSNRSVRNRGLGGAARDRYPLGPMGREQLEPQELVERETLEPGGSRRLTTRVAVTAKRAASKDSPAATVISVIERGRAMTATPVK